MVMSFTNMRPIWYPSICIILSILSTIGQDGSSREIFMMFLDLSPMRMMILVLMELKNHLGGTAECGNSYRKFLKGALIFGNFFGVDRFFALGREYSGREYFAKESSFCGHMWVEEESQSKIF